MPSAEACGVPRELPGPVLEGIGLFNRGEFYRAHERLAEAWLREPRRVRLLYQGILQVGIGFYHRQNGNWRGATRLLRSGIGYLREFEPGLLGVGVAGLVRGCERCLGELEELGPEGVGRFDRSKIPGIMVA
jgi:predicted metal-dependent hydrolase